MSTKKRMPIIKGIVIPSNWDEQGNIKQVSLHTSDEQEYRVEYGGVGRELLAHIHSRVEATGKIREQLDGHLYINVRSFLTVNELSE
jgi:hypothetical protein